MLGSTAILVKMKITIIDKSVYLETESWKIGKNFVFRCGIWPAIFYKFVVLSPLVLVLIIV